MFLVASGRATPARIGFEKLNRDPPTPVGRLAPNQIRLRARMLFVAGIAGPPVCFSVDVKVVQVKGAVAKISGGFRVTLPAERLVVAEKTQRILCGIVGCVTAFWNLGDQSFRIFGTVR